MVATGMGNNCHTRAAREHSRIAVVRVTIFLHAGAPVQILLIEDDVEAASHVSGGLREAGYTVKHCEDGASGLAAARAARYDLLIVDRMLPQLDGLELVAQLRRAEVPTPVLVLSALGTIDDRVE